MKKVLIIVVMCTFISLIWTSPLKSHSKSSNDQNFEKGTKLADFIATKFVSPFMFFTSFLNKIAGTRFDTMANTGALVGSLIATPVQITSSLAPGLISGINSFLVGIPSAFGSRLKVLFNGEYVKNQQFVLNKNNLMDLILLNPTHGIFIEKNSSKTRALKKRGISQTLFKPFAILLGINGLFGGMGSVLTGRGFRAIGDAINSFGDKLIVNGKEIKGAGSTLYTWGTNGHTFPLISSNEDLMSAISLTRKLPNNVNKYIIKFIMPIVMDTISNDDYNEMQTEDQEINNYDKENNFDSNIKKNNNLNQVKLDSKKFIVYSAVIQ